MMAQLHDWRVPDPQAIYGSFRTPFLGHSYPGHHHLSLFLASISFRPTLVSPNHFLYITGMGARLHLAIDLLAPSSKARSSSSSCHIDRQYHHQAIYPHNHHRCKRKLSSSMDRLILDKYKVESIRKTMQAQEEDFRKQLGELHRLYRVQKLLMQEMKQKTNWNAAHTGLTNQRYLQYPKMIGRNESFNLAPQSSSTNVFQFNNYLPELSSTGIPSGALATRTSKSRIVGFDLERPTANDQDDFPAVQQDHTSIKAENMNIDLSAVEGMDTEVELTLSIGLSSSSSSKSSRRKKEKESPTKDLDSLPSFREENSQFCSASSTPMSSSSATLDEEKKRPCWLFRGLSIKRTS